ncbi:MAG: zf-HC2 domain-containing protein [Phycisphaerales bacterium]
MDQQSQASFMTCKDVSEFLMAYIDDELAPDQRTRFEEHLGDCSSCVRYLDQYKRTIRLGQAAFAASDAPASGCVPSGLLEAISVARKQQIN